VGKSEVCGYFQYFSDWFLVTQSSDQDRVLPGSNFSNPHQGEKSETRTPLVLLWYSDGIPPYSTCSSVLQRYSNFFSEYMESRFSPLSQTSINRFKMYLQKFNPNASSIINNFFNCQKTFLKFRLTIENK